MSMFIEMKPNRRYSQRGLTLVELVMFIVIVSVALAGVLTVLNITVKSSADPMIRKQMLAIAEALLEEVQSKAFTWCDLDDPQVATATSNAVGASGCTSVATVEVSGAETISVIETRSNPTVPFDNVNDYAGLPLTSPISDVTATSTAPAGYSATIAVANDPSYGVAAGFLPSTEVLRITVTVSHSSDTLVIEGYRTRYSPNY